MNLKTIKDARGALTVAEKLPFAIRRAYWLHGVDPEATRGGHAHKVLRRLMVAVAGGFRVRVRERRWTDIVLDSPTTALQIEPMTWIELHDFTPGAVCLVLASEEHDEADCIRDFQTFLRERRAA